MKKPRLILAVISALAVSLLSWGKTWETTPFGAKATINDTDIEIQFLTPETARVVKVPSSSAEMPAKSLSITASPDAGIAVNVREQGRNTIISTSGLKVKADNSTGLLSFSTPSGKLLTREIGQAVMTVADFPEANGFTVSQTFYVAPNERLYGLGSLAEINLSRRNFSKRLMPGNIDDGFPVVQSSKGYGIVWDNYSPTLFEDNNKGMTFTSDIADAVDYYFINGDGSTDKVVAQMRKISGDVPMFPLWTYGYWQSRERYKTQHEPTAVVKRYREQNIPLDGIIQDWQYWGNNYLWNAMEFMNPDYDRPQQMIDSIHDMNAHMIISIWSSFGPMTKPFAELKDKKLLFDIATWPQSGIDVWPPRMDYPSGVKVYNAYSKEARDIYWKYLSAMYGMGMDGWWMDSTEPDHFDDKMDFTTGKLGSYRRLKGAYPLMTVGGVYDHQRDADSTKRVFILTRSGWFGQQRYGCNVWTGDVVSTWDMLRKQIPQHLNFTMSGNPNTNSDIGGFFCGRYNMPGGVPAYANPLYEELTTRWTQMGIFTPMMRAHGSGSPCEIYLFGKPGEPVYDALVDAVRLRYSLLPYIYSTSWEVTSHGGSFMRPLVMDFPDDEDGLEANDRFMFGKSLFVAPIVKAHYTQESATCIDTQADANAGWGTNESTSVGNTSRIDFNMPYNVEVLLPKGADWFDFFSGKKYSGGKKAVLTANLSTIPLFARAGSIIPLGPDVNYATEKPWDNLTIKVFPGANGSFTLYEDEGDNYNYEKGDYTTIPFKYDHKSGRLNIGVRNGTFKGMLDNRKFTIQNAATGKTQTVDYAGESLEVKI
ncbi:MAG: glycoside hydrolase family 31 protein [Bacteroides sp.]|nr:glycoside hydrolase family 31 protein [Bacteroides sp.]MCM1095527.1 glycoside hydrolase family 31 protein [Terasakiella sp.]